MADLRTTMLTLRARAVRVLEGLAKWLPALLLRVTIGLIFASTGWGKVHNIDKVTAFFTELKIPMPHLNAIVVGWSELVCGSLLVLGLATRFAVIPLIVSMIVALLTAIRPDIHGFLDLVAKEEFVYLMVLVAIGILGPGKASIDRFIAQKLEAKS
jgi:putative oxidoreductase